MNVIVRDRLGGTLTVEKAGEVSRRWGLPAGVAQELKKDYLVDGNVADAEALVHEVSHAVVFRIPVTPVVSEDVADRFSDYVRKRSSDRAEVVALAVEYIVLEELGWTADLPWETVFNLALEDLRSPFFQWRNYQRADALFVEEVEKPHNARRAGYVIAELWKATGSGPRR